MKRVFTTGQVADICMVAPRTVAKWFDSGRLRGYQIPGGGDRRVPRDILIRFLREHGIPAGRLAEIDGPEGVRVLLVGAAPQLAGRLDAAIRARVPDPGYTVVRAASSGFEAGLVAADYRPTHVLIDAAMGRIEACQIAQVAMGMVTPSGPIVIALGDVGASAGSFHAVMPSGAPAESLAAEICGAASPAAKGA